MFNYLLTFYRRFPRILQDALHIMDRIAAIVLCQGGFPMSRWRTVLLLLLLAALAAGVPRLTAALPTDRQALIGRKYDGWSGVLRLWACPGWQPGAGSFTGWLNRCGAAFEKRHPGVYIQVETVDADALRSWSDAGVSPPDLLLFSPGALDSPRNLLPLDASSILRDGFGHLGEWRGLRYALPVAMGGYVELRTAGDGGMAVPADGEACLWSAALACLPAEDGGDPGAAPAAPELDLGLPAASRVRRDRQVSDAAWRDFSNGDCASLLAAPEGIRRLEALNESGKGPDWTLGAASRFTDQLLFVAASDGGGADKQSLCAAFAAFLLEDVCQGALHRAGAFSVTDCASGYGAGDRLAALETALRGEALLLPRAFDGSWRADIAPIVRDVLEGRANFESVAPQLREKLG